MYELPDKLKNLRPYEPVTGSFSIRLDANESFLPAPDWLRDEIAGAVRALPFHRYPDSGCSELCQKAAAYFGVRESMVAAGNGSDELIGLIVNSFLEQGETLAVVSPDFSMYAFYAQMGGFPVAVFEKPDLVLDAQALIQFVKEKGARLLIFSNPCNPTSLKASQNDIMRIAESLDCLVVADEAYMEFSQGSVLPLTEQCDHLIVLKTCSKAFGMAGIRLGFAVGHPRLVNALKAVKSPYNVNVMTQAVGNILFSHPDYLEEAIAQIKRSRDVLFAAVTELGSRKSEIMRVVPTCANFVLLQTADSRGVFDALARRGIAVRLMGEYLRISAGSETENTRLVAALEEILR